MNVAIAMEPVPIGAVAFTDFALQQLAAVKGVRVERPTPTQINIVHRYTPGWAVIVGVLGLLFFLLGALLWFIKRTDTISVIATDGPDGSAFVSVSGAGPPLLIDLLKHMVSPDTWGPPPG